MSEAGDRLKRSWLWRSAMCGERGRQQVKQASLHIYSFFFFFFASASHGQIIDEPLIDLIAMPMTQRYTILESLILEN